MKDLSEQTYYEVLELAPGCAADALLEAYALAKERYAPGSLATYALAEPSEAEALLRRVEEAFAVLSDPDRRKAYDSAGGYPLVAWERGSERSFAPPPAVLEPEQAQPQASVSESKPLRAPSESSPAFEPVPEQALEVKAAPEPAPVEPGAVGLAQLEHPAATAPEAPPEPPASPPASPPAEPRAEALAEAPAESQPEPEPMAKKAEQKIPEPEHKPVRKTESELPADSAVTGEALRRVREARGLTLKDVESRTKIGHWHLENIERDRYDDLPAQVYLRGFLMSFARELKLDPVRVARSYLEQMKAKPQAKPQAKSE